MKQTFLTIVALLCLAATSQAEPSGTQKRKQGQWTEIRNGDVWTDTDGNLVQAHAPGFLKLGKTWYMVGEDRAHSWNPDVNLYASEDLQHWRFVKKIIQNFVTSPDLGRRRMIERAKLLYNEKTQKYVVWCHWESRNYAASEAACFQSDSIDGNYQLVWSGRPMGIKSRDCNVFVDDDGTAYFISTTEENTNLGLFRLSDDYLTPVSHTPLFEGERREAPAIVRVPAAVKGERDLYFMFNSACSGWAPNQCKMSYTHDLTTGWQPLRNIGDSVAYRTQAAAVLVICGTRQTTYLYVGDRWMDPDLPHSKTIIFPITFQGTECQFHYCERFLINFETGEWKEVKSEE